MKSFLCIGGAVGAVFITAIFFFANNFTLDKQSALIALTFGYVMRMIAGTCVHCHDGYHKGFTKSDVLPITIERKLQEMAIKSQIESEQKFQEACLSKKQLLQTVFYSKWCFS